MVSAGRHPVPSTGLAWPSLIWNNPKSVWFAEIPGCLPLRRSTNAVEMFRTLCFPVAIPLPQTATRSISITVPQTPASPWPTAVFVVFWHGWTRTAIPSTPTTADNSARARTKCFAIWRAPLRRESFFGMRFGFADYWELLAQSIVLFDHAGIEIPAFPDFDLPEDVDGIFAPEAIAALERLCERLLCRLLGENPGKADSTIDTLLVTGERINAVAERVGFELEAFCGRPSPQPKSRCNRDHGNSGGEGGIRTISTR